MIKLFGYIKLFDDSTILKDHKHITALLSFIPNSNSKKSILLFRGSEHGFSAQSFHNKCDGYPDTITIVESQQMNIFGIYLHATFGVFRATFGFMPLE